MPKLKILHAPTTVGGNPHNISEAEKKLGFKSVSMALRKNYLNFPSDMFILGDKKNIIFDEIKIIGAAFISLFQYDVFHYNYGRSIMPLRPFLEEDKFSKWKVFIYTKVYSRFTELLDLKIAHWMGKITAVTYQGTDGRIGGFCRENYPIHYTHFTDSSAYTPEADKIKKQRIKTVDKYADLIYAVNPDLLHNLPERAKFMAYACVHPDEWQPVIKNTPPPYHIVHAPSNRAVKGTQFLIDAIEKLKKEGYDFQFTLVENMSNDEARKVYEDADILIDQLLAGFYGGLAVECMALGKAVICYMRQEDLKFMPKQMVEDMPIINSTPDEIYEVLKKTIQLDRQELMEVGHKSRDYVVNWHHPDKIAKSLIEDYQRVYKAKRKSA